MPLNLYEGTKGWLSRKLQNCVEQIDSSIFGSAVYAAADFVCQVKNAPCKAFAYCFNYAQEKIPDKDLSRILTGVGMIVGGAGKVTGAVALAALSAPLCAAGIGVAGEIAAGIVAASGGGDIAQGIQEIMYGWNGDSESESFNLVRDTLYCGNEEAYQISTGIAAASADLGKLLEVGLTKIAAKKAAKSVAKEAAEAVAKDAAEAAAKEAIESAAKGAGGLIDEAVEATAKEAAESAIKESVKQGTKDAIEDVAEDSVDDLLKNTEDFYDDIFDPYYKEQFNPIGEEAIGNPNGIEGISKSSSKSGSGSKFQEVFDLADNYTLSDDTFDNHILDRHGPNSTYGNKSHFNADFDIRNGIDSTLTGDKFIVGPNTAGREGYIFEQTFSNPIGTNSKGKPLYTLKVVIDEAGYVITAFPKK